MDFDYGLICVVLNAFLYIFTFLISLRYFNRIVNFIVFVYAVSSSLGVVEYSYRVNEWNITLVPYIYFYLVFIVIISPLVKFKGNNLNISNNDFPASILAFILLIISYSIIIKTFLIFDRDYLGVGYSMSDIYTETRKSGYSQANRNLNVSIFSLLNFISSVLQYLSVFIIFYFLSFKKFRMKNITIEILLISIVVTLFGSLLGADRSQTIRHIIYFISGYLIFKEGLKFPKYIKYQLIFIFFVGVFLFSLITISRFGNKESSKVDNTIQYSIINYASQGMLHFNAHFFKNEIYCTHGDYTASFVRFLLRKKSSKGFNDADENWNLTDPNVSGHVFNTFLGPFLLDYGKWVTLPIMLLISLFIRYYIQWDNLKLDSLLILYVYIVMILFGLITYQYSYFFGSLNLLIFITLAFLIRERNKMIKNSN